MRRFTIFIGLILSVNSIAAQNRELAADLLYAIHIHDTAQVVKSELVSLEAFEKLVKKYPNEWLPSYWAAYLCTQIARLDGRDPGFPKSLSYEEMIGKAETHFAACKAKAININTVEKSDLHAMQGFIYTFLRKAINDKYDSLVQREYKKSLAINPLNVNLQIQFAIGLSNRAGSSYQDLVTALGIFEYNRIFFGKIDNRALTTYYAKDFVDFWRRNTEEKLTKMISSP